MYIITAYTNFTLLSSCRIFQIYDKDIQQICEISIQAEYFGTGVFTNCKNCLQRFPIYIYIYIYI